MPGRPLVFPQDHGAHPDFLTEWWYYTGNLADEAGRRYGYQLTFFRRALQPPAETTPRPSDWAASQAYMAHFAITAADQGDHRSAEKLAAAPAVWPAPNPPPLASGWKTGRCRRSNPASIPSKPPTKAP